LQQRTPDQTRQRRVKVQKGVGKFVHAETIPSGGAGR